MDITKEHYPCFHGQQCDLIDCPSRPIQASWEELFDKQFKYIDEPGNGTVGYLQDSKKNTVKSFIRTAIETAIKEERERIAEVVEKMKVQHQEFENNVGRLHCDPVTEICEITAHNLALSDVLSIINSPQ